MASIPLKQALQGTCFYLRLGVGSLAKEQYSLLLFGVQSLCKIFDLLFLDDINVVVQFWIEIMKQGDTVFLILRKASLDRTVSRFRVEMEQYQKYEYVCWSVGLLDWP